MRQLVPALLSLTALAAADTSAERSLRSVESAQRGVAQLTEQTVTRADQLADDLRFNRIGDAKDADQVKSLAGDLAQLTVAKPGEATMPWVQERLAAARRAGGGKDLGEAHGGQARLTDRLDTLAKNARGRLAGADGVRGLRDAIETQQRLMEQTKDLSDRLLGKEREDLTAQEKAELERLANQQRGLEDALKEAGEELREQAQGAEDQREKSNLENAAKDLEDAKAGDKAKKAANELSDNNLSEAQRRQQELLDALEKADQKLSGMDQDRLSELDKQMQRMQQMEQKQKELLKQTQETQKDASQEEFDKLRTEQAELADDLKQQQQDAAKDAEQAEDALKDKDKQRAEQEMKDALEKMKQSMQKMQQEMQQLQQQRQQQDQQQQQQQDQQQQQQQQNKPPQDGGLEDGERGAKKKRNWQVGLEPQEREVLSQVQVEKFPGRYEQALVEYYRALAGEEEGK